MRKKIAKYVYNMIIGGVKNLPELKEGWIDYGEFIKIVNPETVRFLVAIDALDKEIILSEDGSRAMVRINKNVHIAKEIASCIEKAIERLEDAEWNHAG